ncbi:MAG: zeta toxin family protein [Rhodocyclaceae bacterium]|nr:zeta toxin family protein [Rhodocyclaceae bacterium]
MTTTNAGGERFHAWNPGIGTGIPAAFRDLETLYRPECTLASRDEIEAYMSLTGLPPERLAVFRPERLVLHELIVRVTAEIAVPEGAEEEAFGKNFRHIALTVLTRYVAPHLAEIEARHVALGRRVERAVSELLGGHRPAPAPAVPKPRHWLSRLLAPGPRQAPPEPPGESDEQTVARFTTLAEQANDPETRAIHKSLARVLGAILLTRGSLGADRELLVRLVRHHVGNTYGSRIVGEAIAPLLEQAIEREGLQRAPLRETPILISLKGPSAAGKSSLRPMLKRVMREHGIEAERFVTISPDIWRRLLLDFESLGDARKYAGQLTSREVMVVDAKLDRHIRDKAQRDQTIPDILVDRFRFDSFDGTAVARVLHKTYASFVHTMYMYFVVTPPSETVERGWRRALERGRYKSVEDFLGHSVEAYSGMSKIFFRWLAQRRPDYRYVFLDNRVPKGEFPKLAASGDQREMTIVDPLVLVNIERYRRINIYARNPQEVDPPTARLAIADNMGFLLHCLRAIETVKFASSDGDVYLYARNGRVEVVDRSMFSSLGSADPELREVFAQLPVLTPPSTAT